MCTCKTVEKNVAVIKEIVVCPDNFASNCVASALIWCLHIRSDAKSLLFRQQIYVWYFGYGCWLWHFD